METLIITRENIPGMVDSKELTEELRQGFINYSKGASRRDGQRLTLDISNGNKTTVLGPGTSAGIPAYTIKANSKFPRDKIAIKGVISLFDIENGHLLGLMDSSLITSIRTGLAAAMATGYLAPVDAKKISIIGAGSQNQFALKYLLSLRALEKVSVFDPNEQNAADFTKLFEGRIKCEMAGSLSDCIAKADIISLATWSRAPLLGRKDLTGPCHITSLGSDEKEKVEVSGDLVMASKFYCDDVDLNLAMGTPGNLGLPKSCVHAEIGEAYLNPEKGRNNDEEITVYSCVGLPFQDLITAWHIYRRAVTAGNALRIKMN